MENFNIVITSAGFNDLFNFVSTEIIELFRALSVRKKVLIISNAAPEGTGNFPSLAKIRENFLNVGAVKVDIIDINDSNTQILADYEVIYGAGGDPYHLIELANRTNFKKHLVKFLETGVYIGESAGSMILCDDLKWAYIVKKGTKPKYDVKLETYQGLGLTDHKIFPHWGKVSDEVKDKVMQYENQHSIKITRLNDGEIMKIQYPSRK